MGVIVVHRARLLPRLLLVAAITGVSLLVTGAIVWIAVLGTDPEVSIGRGGGTRVVERGAEAEIVHELPRGWPEALRPPTGSMIVSSVTSSAPEEQLVLVVEAPGAGVPVAEALRAQLAAAGLEVTADGLGPDGTGGLTAAGGGWDASISVGATPARLDVTTVSWVLRPLR